MIAGDNLKSFDDMDDDFAFCNIAIDYLKNLKYRDKDAKDNYTNEVLLKVPFAKGAIPLGKPVHPSEAPFGGPPRRVPSPEKDLSYSRIRRSRWDFDRWCTTLVGHVDSGVLTFTVISKGRKLPFSKRHERFGKQSFRGG